MKTQPTTYGLHYFRNKLTDYLKARHPDMKNPRILIERRSSIAHGIFRQARRAGKNIPHALGEADTVLYSGLIFSRFDTVAVIIETDFQEIPPAKIKKTALALLPWCGEVFERYRTDDNFYHDPQCDELTEEVKERIKNYFDIHIYGVQ